MSDAVDELKETAVARIVGALGVPITRSHKDWRLPSGQRLLLVYAKPQHHGRELYVGLPNRLRSGDALVLLLGASDVVFESAGSILAYVPYMSRSNDGRPNPRFRTTRDGLVLSVVSLEMELPLADRIACFDRLLPNGDSRPTAAKETIGRTFRVADEDRKVKRRQSLELDLEAQDRATQGHAWTLNRLGEFLRARDIEPRECALGEPQYDLAWARNGELYVAEVKSLSTQNERQQLRLGLGQLLQYQRALLEMGRPARAVLAVERRPDDLLWLRLCHDLDVLLVWPDAFTALTT